MPLLRFFGRRRRKTVPVPLPPPAQAPVLQDPIDNGDGTWTLNVTHPGANAIEWYREDEGVVSLIATTTGLTYTDRPEAVAPGVAGTITQGVHTPSVVNASATAPTGGSGAWSYQWRGNGVPIPGASSLSLAWTGRTSPTTYSVDLVATDTVTGQVLTYTAVPMSTPAQQSTGAVLYYAHNFNDGSLGDFTQWGGYTPKPVTVVADPTGSGRGMVAKVVYERNPFTQSEGSRDVNGGLYSSQIFDNHVPERVGFGGRIYFKGDFYIPFYDPGFEPQQKENAQAKLLYLKFGEWNAGAMRVDRTGGIFPVVWGKAGTDNLEMWLTIENNITGIPDDAYGVFSVVRNTWYTMGLELVVNHRGVEDGEMRLWINGVLVYEVVNKEIFHALEWMVNPYIYEFGVGNQAQWGPGDMGIMKIWRLWDNISFYSRKD